MAARLAKSTHILISRNAPPSIFQLPTRRMIFKARLHPLKSLSIVPTLSRNRSDNYRILCSFLSHLPPLYPSRNNMATTSRPSHRTPAPTPLATTEGTTYCHTCGRMICMSLPCLCFLPFNVRYSILLPIIHVDRPTSTPSTVAWQSIA